MEMNKKNKEIINKEDKEEKEIKNEYINLSDDQLWSIFENLAATNKDDKKNKDNKDKDTEEDSEDKNNSDTQSETDSEKIIEDDSCPQCKSTTGCVEDT